MSAKGFERCSREYQLQKWQISSNTFPKTHDAYNGLLYSPYNLAVFLI